MRVYLIRHAESEHNVARVYAGATDSSLTNHGMLQIDRLARHFRYRGIQFSRVFSSPLQRARLTAEPLCRSLNNMDTCVDCPLTIVGVLQEKNYGSLEGRSFYNSTKLCSETSAFIPAETQEMLVDRAKSFIHQHLLPLLNESEGLSVNVAVVSHGIMLLSLWSSLTQLSGPLPGPTLEVPNLAWSNTGYLEFDVRFDTMQLAALPVPTSNSPILPNQPFELGYLPNDRIKIPSPVQPTLSIRVHAVNEKSHLDGLQRTKGGIGSAKHDATQKKLDDYFRKS
ncbi:hypothetical protein FQN57_003580 [Myotisia sp. PD_48]|nr:hypothetical protein FQN57_003580 [Myotisia sp. PD_48]